MKYFPFTLHFILAMIVIGLAVGAHLEGFRPLIQGGLIGLAAGLGVSYFVRTLWSIT